MQQQWKSIMLFVLAAGILCVGIWIVANGNLKWSGGNLVWRLQRPYCNSSIRTN